MIQFSAYAREPAILKYMDLLGSTKAWETVVNGFVRHSYRVYDNALLPQNVPRCPEM